MLIIHNDSLDPAFNLALEEVLFHDAADDVCMLWQNDRTVVVGRNQNTLAEVDCAYAKANGIRVVRRNTGGGAVYHDLGNLNFTFIRRGAAHKFLDFSYFNRTVIDTLKAFGADAAEQKNDIFVAGKKVSGGAQTVRAGAVLHHGTLLFSVNTEALCRVLTPHPLKLESKAVPSVRARVGNLSDYLTCGIPAFKAALLSAVRRDGAAETDARDSGFYERASRLKCEKYDTFDWNYGGAPAYTFRAAAYTKGGLIEVSTEVLAGRFSAVRLTGDFSGERPVAELEQALIGVRQSATETADALRAAGYTRYLANIDIATLSALLCGENV